MKHHHQKGAISLLATALLMLTVTLAAMAFLFNMRYGHFPMQEVFAKWTKSASATANAVNPLSAEQSFGDGLRRCVIHGKVIFSNTECKDDNKSSKKLDLHDSKGFEAPVEPVVEKEKEKTSIEATDKIIDKMSK